MVRQTWNKSVNVLAPKEQPTSIAEILKATADSSKLHHYATLSNQTKHLVLHCLHSSTECLNVIINKRSTMEINVFSYKQVLLILINKI